MKNDTLRAEHGGKVSTDLRRSGHPAVLSEQSPPAVLTEVGFDDGLIAAGDMRAVAANVAELQHLLCCEGAAGRTIGVVGVEHGLAAVPSTLVASSPATVELPSMCEMWLALWVALH